MVRMLHYYPYSSGSISSSPSRFLRSSESLSRFARSSESLSRLKIVGNALSLSITRKYLIFKYSIHKFADVQISNTIRSMNRRQRTCYSLEYFMSLSHSMCLWIKMFLMTLIVGTFKRYYTSTPPFAMCKSSALK